MVVHAHPDDEVFSTGGILAKYAHAGDRVAVVYCTRGEAGEMHNADLNAEEAMLRLGDIREEEAHEANTVLGVTNVYFLGYRDSGMAGTKENKNPAAFMNVPMEESVARLMDIMREVEPDVVVTYGEDGGYGHPDHVMTHRITLEAYGRSQGEDWAPKKLYYSARSREGFRRQVEQFAELGFKFPWISDDFNFDEFGAPDSEITAHIDISSYVSLKKRALAVHRTQIPSDFFYLSIPDEALVSAAGHEYFLRIVPPPEHGEHETDLFAGLGQRNRSTAGAAASREV